MLFLPREGDWVPGTPELISSTVAKAGTSPDALPPSSSVSPRPIPALHVSAHPPSTPLLSFPRPFRSEGQLTPHQIPKLNAARSCSRV